MLSPYVRDKIAARGITEQHVREAFELCALTRARGHRNAQGEWRLLVTGTVHGGRLLNGVLHPVDTQEGIWNLKTALWAR
jgi:hypothetical protein